MRAVPWTSRWRRRSRAASSTCRAWRGSSSSRARVRGGAARRPGRERARRRRAQAAVDGADDHRRELPRLLHRTAGSLLGPQAASADVTPAGTEARTSHPRSVTVGDTLEPNDTPATAQPVDTDAFQLSYVTSAGDVDYFKYDPPVKPPVGSRVSVHLSHLPGRLRPRRLRAARGELRPPRRLTSRSTARRSSTTAST